MQVHIGLSLQEIRGNRLQNMLKTSKDNILGFLGDIFPLNNFALLERQQGDKKQHWQNPYM